MSCASLVPLRPPSSARPNSPQPRTSRTSCISAVACANRRWRLGDRPAASPATRAVRSARKYRVDAKAGGPPSLRRLPATRSPILRLAAPIRNCRRAGPIRPSDRRRSDRGLGRPTPDKSRDRPTVDRPLARRRANRASRGADSAASAYHVRSGGAALCAHSQRRVRCSSGDTRRRVCRRGNAPRARSRRGRSPPGPLAAARAPKRLGADRDPRVDQRHPEVRLRAIRYGPVVTSAVEALYGETGVPARAKARTNEPIRVPPIASSVPPTGHRTAGGTQSPAAPTSARSPPRARQGRRAAAARSRVPIAPDRGLRIGVHAAKYRRVAVSEPSDLVQ